MGSAGFYYVKEVTVDIKLIAATNQKPEKLVEEGTFRKDLYYRLNTIKIEIPPLKERREDIIPLIYFFLTKFNKKYKVKTVFTERALTIMEQYDWPGNVRELEHMIERMILINDNEILDLPDLPQELQRKKEHKTAAPTENPLHIPSKEEEKREIIQNYIELKSTYKVAKKMNISQSKVARIIKQHREQSDSVFRS
ncbi:MAG: sigma 54-interacting transcriptional regulator [Clostridia bacterium]